MESLRPPPPQARKGFDMATSAIEISKRLVVHNHVMKSTICHHTIVHTPYYPTKLQETQETQSPIGGGIGGDGSFGSSSGSSPGQGTMWLPSPVCSEEEASPVADRTVPSPPDMPTAADATPERRSFGGRRTHRSSLPFFVFACSCVDRFILGARFCLGNSPILWIQT